MRHGEIPHRIDRHQRYARRDHVGPVTDRIRIVVLERYARGRGCLPILDLELFDAIHHRVGNEIAVTQAHAHQRGQGLATIRRCGARTARHHVARAQVVHLYLIGIGIPHQGGIGLRSRHAAGEKFGPVTRCGKQEDPVRVAGDGAGRDGHRTGRQHLRIGIAQHQHVRTGHVIGCTADACRIYRRTGGAVVAENATTAGARVRDGRSPGAVAITLVVHRARGAGVNRHAGSLVTTPEIHHAQRPTHAIGGDAHVFLQVVVARLHLVGLAIGHEQVDQASHHKQAQHHRDHQLDQRKAPCSVGHATHGTAIGNLRTGWAGSRNCMNHWWGLRWRWRACRSSSM